MAGGLLTWAHSYISNEVHTQLAAQQIYFPAANSEAVAAPEFEAMRQYGGQQLTTGAQAEVYADHFIANHLKEIGGGKTYAQLSAESIAQPNNAKLAAQVATVFKGETLRGLLLNAYAFGTMGMIAGIAADRRVHRRRRHAGPQRPRPDPRPPHLPRHRHAHRPPRQRPHQRQRPTLQQR